MLLCLLLHDLTLLLLLRSEAASIVQLVKLIISNHTNLQSSYHWNLFDVDVTSRPSSVYALRELICCLLISCDFSLLSTLVRLWLRLHSTKLCSRSLPSEMIALSLSVVSIRGSRRAALNSGQTSTSSLSSPKNCGSRRAFSIYPCAPIWPCSRALPFGTARLQLILLLYHTINLILTLYVLSKRSHAAYLQDHVPASTAVMQP